MSFNWRSISCSWLLLLLFLISSSQKIESLPLSTKGRWIVDTESGKRVKLRCVNWAAHMPEVLAEGLDRRSVGEIASTIADLGFNCVRLTWATHMFTDPLYKDLTVESSLARQKLWSAVAGVAKNNPAMMNLTVIQAYDEVGSGRNFIDRVVRTLGSAGVMVVLDNHVSKPQWCCSNDDGNGFFGDTYFNPDEWVRGLRSVARRFRGVSQVVAMSLRNELRGPKQSESAWYDHVGAGVNTVHSVNPDVLVIVSGLNYDINLSFLKSKPLAINIGDKLVYEAHWYSFSHGKPSPNMKHPSQSQSCEDEIKRFDKLAGFVMLTEGMPPLFLSEFGGDQRGVNSGDNRFLSCFRAFAAERDVDWAMWVLQGSYYRRQGVDGFEEMYGVLDSNWKQSRDPNFREKFRLIQEMLQDPNSTDPAYQTIYHPQTGKCVTTHQNNNTIFLNDCRNRTHWTHDGDGTPIRPLGTNLCLSAEGGVGSPAIITSNCNDSSSKWTVSSATGFQVHNGMDSKRKKLCLDWNSTSNSSLVLIKECLKNKRDSVYFFPFVELIPVKILEFLFQYLFFDNPQSQWFNLISSNV